MGELVIALAQLFVGLGLMLSTGPEPEPPPTRHSRAVNICHPVIFDHETGGTKVDRTVDLCRRDR